MTYIRKSVVHMHYERKLRLLDYMKAEQATTDAAVDLDIPLQTVWRYMREMQKSGHVIKVGQSYYAKYKASGKPLYMDEVMPGAKKKTKGVMICGVRF